MHPPPQSFHSGFSSLPALLLPPARARRASLADSVEKSRLLRLEVPRLSTQESEASLSVPEEPRRLRQHASVTSVGDGAITLLDVLSEEQFLTEDMRDPEGPETTEEALSILIMKNPDRFRQYSFVNSLKTQIVAALLFMLVLLVFLVIGFTSFELAILNRPQSDIPNLGRSLLVLSFAAGFLFWCLLCCIRQRYNSTKRAARLAGVTYTPLEMVRFHLVQRIAIVVSVCPVLAGTLALATDSEIGDADSITEPFAVWLALLASLLAVNVLWSILAINWRTQTIAFLATVCALVATPAFREGWGRSFAVVSITLCVVAALAFHVFAVSVTLSNERIKLKGFVEKKLLFAERTSTNVLLRALLPRQIYLELSIYGTVRRRQRMSTVAFVKIETFDTSGRELLDTRRQVELIHAVVVQLDVLLANEKVETSGVIKVEHVANTYLLASGLLLPKREASCVNHAARLCEVCLRMSVAVKKLDLEGAFVTLKVGIHSGKTVGTVIGQKRKFFRIFGDAVNMASRVCTTGISNTIQCSAECFRLASKWPQFVWRDRGLVWMKGKGRQRVYLIDRDQSLNNFDRPTLSERLGRRPRSTFETSGRYETRRNIGLANFGERMLKYESLGTLLNRSPELVDYLTSLQFYEFLKEAEKRIAMLTLRFSHFACLTITEKLAIERSSSEIVVNSEEEQRKKTEARAADKNIRTHSFTEGVKRASRRASLQIAKLLHGKTAHPSMTRNISAVVPMEDTSVVTSASSVSEPVRLRVETPNLSSLLPALKEKQTLPKQSHAPMGTAGESPEILIPSEAKAEPPSKTATRLVNWEDQFQWHFLSRTWKWQCLVAGLVALAHISFIASYVVIGLQLARGDIDLDDDNAVYLRMTQNTGAPYYEIAAIIFCCWHIIALLRWKWIDTQLQAAERKKLHTKPQDYEATLVAGGVAAGGGVVCDEISLHWLNFWRCTARFAQWPMTFIVFLIVYKSVTLPVGGPTELAGLSVASRADALRQIQMQATMHGFLSILTLSLAALTGCAQFRFMVLLVVSDTALTVMRAVDVFRILPHKQSGTSSSRMHIDDILSQHEQVQEFLVVLPMTFGALVLLCALAYDKERAVRRTWMLERALTHNKQQLSNLLQNLLPPFVLRTMRALKPENAIDTLVSAEFFDSTVFESDLVNFTAVCSKMSPMEVVDMLNTLYVKYDELVGKHGIEKIETIGDAFIAVNFAGPPDSVLDFALDILAVHRQYSEHDIGARIGIAYGWTIGCKLGVSSIRYHVFGDALDLAVKLEEKSDRGRILVSKTVVENATVLCSSVEPSSGPKRKDKIHVIGPVEAEETSVVQKYIFLPHPTEEDAFFCFDPDQIEELDAFIAEQESDKSKLRQQEGAFHIKVDAEEEASLVRSTSTIPPFSHTSSVGVHPKVPLTSHLLSVSRPATPKSAPAAEAVSPETSVSGLSGMEVDRPVSSKSAQSAREYSAKRRASIQRHMNAMLSARHRVKTGIARHAGAGRPGEPEEPEATRLRRMSSISQVLRQARRRQGKAGMESSDLAETALRLDSLVSKREIEELSVRSHSLDENKRLERSTARLRQAALQLRMRRLASTATRNLHAEDFPIILPADVFEREKHERRPSTQKEQLEASKRFDFSELLAAAGYRKARRSFADVVVEKTNISLPKKTPEGEAEEASREDSSKDDDGNSTIVRSRNDQHCVQSPPAPDSPRIEVPNLLKALPPLVPKASPPLVGSSLRSRKTTTAETTRAVGATGENEAVIEIRVLKEDGAVLTRDKVQHDDAPFFRDFSMHSDTSINESDGGDLHIELPATDAGSSQDVNGGTESEPSLTD